VVVVVGRGGLLASPSGLAHGRGAMSGGSLGAAMARGGGRPSSMLAVPLLPLQLMVRELPPRPPGGLQVLVLRRLKQRTRGRRERGGGAL
jgi:hypothetical protein